MPCDFVRIGGFEKAAVEVHHGFVLGIVGGFFDFLRAGIFQQQPVQVNQFIALWVEREQCERLGGYFHFVKALGGVDRTRPENRVQPWQQGIHKGGFLLPCGSARVLYDFPFCVGALVPEEKVKRFAVGL